MMAGKANDLSDVDISERRDLTAAENCCTESSVRTRNGGEDQNGDLEVPTVSENVCSKASDDKNVNSKEGRNKDDTGAEGFLLCFQADEGSGKQKTDEQNVLDVCDVKTHVGYDVEYIDAAAHDKLVDLEFSNSERDNMNSVLFNSVKIVSGFDVLPFEGSEMLDNIQRFLFLDDGEEVPSELLHVSANNSKHDAASASSNDAAEAPKAQCSNVGGVIVEDEDLKPNTFKDGKTFDVDEYFQAAVIAYFSSLPVDSPGKEVIREMRFLVESLGVNLRCRISICIGAKEAVQREAGELEDTRVLQKCILKCTYCENDKNPCGFSITVKTLVPEEDDEGLCYVEDFLNAMHNHSPSKRRAGIRFLPPNMRREALNMTNTLHMSLPYTIKFLEDKYSIFINPRSVRQMLTYD